MAGPPADDRTGSADCDNCGGPVSTTMQFCPSCGSHQGAPTGDENEPTHRRAHGQHWDRSDPQADRARSQSDARAEPHSSPTAGGGQGSDPTTRRQRDTDRQRLEARLMTELENGWELEHDFGDHAVLMKRSVGPASTHLLIALITIWFTMGMANALYAGYKYFGDVERKVVRPDRTHRTGGASSADSVATTQTNAPTNSLSAGRIFTIGLLWLFALWLILDASLYASGFGVLLVATGAAMIPSVRRRIRDRETVTTNGRTQNVTERSVRSPEKPCVVCHRSIDDGIERTYRERFRLFGIALVTTDTGENHYCRTCAGFESTTRDQSDDRDENTNSTSTTEAH